MWMRIIPVATIALSMILPVSSVSEENKSNGHDLHVGFYKNNCPDVELVVRIVVHNAFEKDPRVAAGLIRLFFHDCFVNGCDASILLDSTPSGEPVEKKSRANGDTLRGLDVIDDIKTQVESQCPDTVSCADILAFATREAVYLSGLPYHPVPAGRRDGNISRASDIPLNLPAPMSSVEQSIKLFAKKGLNVEKMVTLIGAHSIGAAHCSSFDYRLHNFNATNSIDPKLDMAYAIYLKRLCLAPLKGLAELITGKKRLVDFDPKSPIKLDNSFYQDVLRGRGLLQIDQAMAYDPQTSDFVKRFAFGSETFSAKFIQAMIRLGQVDVLTGNRGQIRKNCRAIN